MPTSAGVLLFRRHRLLEILLVHPGGPFWRHRDQGAWQIPKGLVEPAETPEAAARREVAEELGIDVVGPLIALGSVRQAGGKIVHAFAVERDFDPAGLTSNMVEIEWPPASGQRTRFPEIDAARWFAVVEAERAMLASQLPFIERLLAAVDHSPHPD
ncbi:NUDIX domain-containing protein [Sphingomonas sp.]|uniref:NUDIX domain-containing protein n=1 Tax=Sphingomonas sp. TaxID=28214 RepID=UPI0025EEAE1F|nr:NUDIX domain-containing protein [Sphingomonas sp.]